LPQQRKEGQQHQKTILKALPRDNRWLVVHGIYFIDEQRQEANRLDSDNIVIDISCYGEGGKLLSGLRDNISVQSETYNHRLVYADAGTDWIVKHKGRTRYIPVFSTMHINGI
jgi:hypothetical protein